MTPPPLAALNAVAVARATAALEMQAQTSARQRALAWKHAALRLREGLLRLLGDAAQCQQDGLGDGSARPAEGTGAAAQTVMSLSKEYALRQEQVTAQHKELLRLARQRLRRCGVEHDVAAALAAPCQHACQPTRRACPSSSARGARAPASECRPS